MRKRAGFLVMAVLLFVAILVIITLVAASTSIEIIQPDPVPVPGPIPGPDPKPGPDPIPPSPPIIPHINLSVNQEVVGNLPSGSDTVVYKVTIDSAGYVILDFSHANLHKKQSGWFIQLADDSSNVLVDFTSHWNDLKCSSPAIGLPAGTYWVSIFTPYNFSWNAAQYNFAVRFTATNNWETEFNGSYENADTISVNSTVTGTLRTYYDVDAYTFTLNSPGSVYLEFSHANLIRNYIGWHITLFDDRSNKLTRSTSLWNETLNTSTKLSLPAGIYFVIIELPYQSSKWNTEKYTLKVHFSLDNNEIPETIPTDILSEGKIQNDQLVSFLLEKNPNLDNAYVSELIERYITEANQEGVNYEIAIAQMCFHTNYLTFTKTVVTKDQNNFTGLVYDDMRTAYTFDSTEIGIRAHIQHLKGYATTEPLIQECVDPKYSSIKHGTATTIDGLDGRWAGNKYADRICSILIDMRE